MNQNLKKMKENNMETTGQSIMKKLSGEAMAGVGTGVRIAKAFEDMAEKGKEASAQNQGSTSQTNKEAEMKQKALSQAQNKIDNKAQQNRDTMKRIEEVKTQANQGKDYMTKREVGIGGGR